MSIPTTALDAETIREKVREGYSRVARTEPARQVSCCGGASSCGQDRLAESIGYAHEDLATLPETANMGLSCGNPAAIAAIAPGEVVLDLGSGGGFDAFLAGPRVGPEGRVIGVDMTPDMISRARRGLAAYEARTGLANVEFRLGEIEHLPVSDASVDVVISNCVINLSPDKPQVWREIFRVLKPGGRVAISDLALLRPIPQAISGMVEALIGCIAGAPLIADTRSMMTGAGFPEPILTSNPAYVTAMINSEDPLYREIMRHVPDGTEPADYITSLSIAAVKPAS